MLTVTDVVRQFDREPVLDRISFDLRAGERIGLVGPNGAGKTTLLKILVGEDPPDAGQVTFLSGATVELLEQHPEFTPGRTLMDEARAGLADIFQLQHEAAELAQRMSVEADAAQLARLSKRYDVVQHELHHLDGFHVDHRIDEVLQGLGFHRDQYDQALTTLSGGQQNRVLLARLLLKSPSLMLLDEPTNHLDIAATEWLENHLVDARRTVIVVSHDRYFLDRVCTRILELNRGRLSDYPGNFTQYWRLREERQVVADRAWQKQQEFIAKTEEYIVRNRYGQNATRAKDREHKLARALEETVDRIQTITAPPMGFAPPTRTGDWVIDAVNLTKGYDRPLFENLSLRIQRGERWGLLGPNGAGKTTLLRTLLGEIPPDRGTTRFGTNVNYAYFDQQLHSVDPTATAMEAIRPPDIARYTDGQLRDLLARFGVVGELALQTVGAMSGGERSKVALARLAALEPNVLILDEPTNHLDLWSRDALERSLREFAGTVLFVSHDRYFLDRVATNLLVYEDGRWFEYAGNYTAYVAFRKAVQAEQKAAPVKGAIKEPARSSDKEPRRKRKFPYRKVADLEADIATAEGTLAQCQVDLADTAVHRDPNRLKAVMELYQTTQTRLETLFEHWEEAVELN
jgi:ATP-binding cassette, subfamily F, member 3